MAVAAAASTGEAKAAAEIKKTGQSHRTLELAEQTSFDVDAEDPLADFRSAARTLAKNLTASEEYDRDQLVAMKLMLLDAEKTAESVHPREYRRVFREFREELATLSE